VGLSRLGSSDDHQTPGNSQTSGNSQWGDNPNSARRLVGLFDRSVSVRHNTVRFSLTYPDVRSDCQQLSAGSRGVIPRASRSDTPQVTGRNPLNPTENPAESHSSTRDHHLINTRSPLTNASNSANAIQIGTTASNPPKFRHNERNLYPPTSEPILSLWSDTCFQRCFYFQGQPRR